MKNIICVTVLTIVVSCCTNRLEPIALKNAEENKAQSEISFLSFDSEQALYNAINMNSYDGNTKVSHDRDINNLFTLVGEYDSSDDPVLLYELSRFDKSEYPSDVTFYELLHYDEMVPNENFAKLINVRGEFCVSDNIYKISPRGTYYFPVYLRDYFSEHYSEFEVSDGILVSDNTYLLSPSIYRYDTFGDSFKDEVWSYCIEEGVETKSDPFPVFSWSNYPTYSGPYSDYLSNDVFTYSLPSNRRIKTCVFHNNYVVYQERGAYVKCQKKVTLGWSDVTSKALLLSWRNMVFDRSLYEYEMPAYDYMGYTTGTLEDENGHTYSTIRVSGIALTESQINSVVVGGASALRSIVRSAVGVNIDFSGYYMIELLRTRVQTIFLRQDMQQEFNKTKNRIVFNSSWFSALDKIVGGQFMYGAIDDNENFGALRVGTAF